MIYELAGVVGLAPDPFTLRELRWMADGRQKALWQPASVMMSLFVNANRKPGSRPVTPRLFDPFAEGAGDGDAIPTKVKSLKGLVPQVAKLVRAEKKTHAETQRRGT